MTSRPPGKLKWSPEEEAALRAGVAIYGKGKWRAIQKDPRFAMVLAHRSNIDLKDKWRNLNIKGTSPQPDHQPPSHQPPRPADSGGHSDATAQHMALIDHVLRVVGYLDEAADAPLLDTAAVPAHTTDSNLSTSSTKRPHDDAVSTVELFAPTIPTKRQRTVRRGPVVHPADEDMLLAGVAVDSAAHGGSATVQGVIAWVEGHYQVSPMFRDTAEAIMARLVDQGRLCLVGQGRYALAMHSTHAAELDKAAAVAAAKLTSHVMACVLMQQRWEDGRCAVDELRGVDRLPSLAASH